jgi:uncharacterized lipoprotein YbaY
MVLEPSKIDQNHTYAIEAEISVGKRGVWTTTARQAAITRGSPTTGLTVWLERTRPEPQANE